MEKNRPPQIAKPLALPQSQPPAKPPQLASASTDAVKNGSTQPTEKQQAAAAPSLSLDTTQKATAATAPLSLPVATPTVENLPQLPTETVRPPTSTSLSPNSPTTQTVTARKQWSKQSTGFANHDRTAPPSHSIMTVSSM